VKITEVRPSQVKICKNRIRSDSGNLNDIEKSFEPLGGLLQPIGIAPDKTLIWGERRLKAWRKKYGDEPIPAVVFEGNRRLAEIVENIKRKQLTWPDEVRAIAEFDEICRQLYGEKPKGRPKKKNGANVTNYSESWSLRKTEELLGVNHAEVIRAKRLAEGIERFPQITQAETKGAALHFLHELESAEERKHAELPKLEDFALGDCLEIIPTLEAGSARCIVTDPPYGVDLKSHWMGYPSELYKERMIGDKRDEAQPLIDKMLTLIVPKMAEDSALYMFTGFESYPWLYYLIKKHLDFRNCLVWAKHKIGAGDWKWAYGYSHEFIIYATKGRPPLFGAQDMDVLEFSRVGEGYRLHPAQKPVDLLKFLIQKSTVEGELVIDPFAGSGSTAIAALATDRRYFCVEKDRNYYEKAVMRIEKFKNAGGVGE